MKRKKLLVVNYSRGRDLLFYNNSFFSFELYCYKEAYYERVFSIKK